MNVIKFDIEKGVYLTEITDIKSDIHNHPAMEIIIAKRGQFTISTENGVFKNLRFAIIDSNKDHQLIVANSKVIVLIVEHQDKFLKDYFFENKLKINNGLLLSENFISQTFIDNLIFNILQKKEKREYDPRVQKLIDYLKKNQVNYFHLRKEAQKITNLSYSRISHLFKENIGISLKRYLVWCSLRYAVNVHLKKNSLITDSFLLSGFYDQPHFNKSYKTFIGTSPSRTYR